tara:strand:+ start:270 stop:587 length:318 start_codon:yes stop_codon:yes gene_type:complete
MSSEAWVQLVPEDYNNLIAAVGQEVEYWKVKVKVKEKAADKALKPKKWLCFTFLPSMGAIHTARWPVRMARNELEFWLSAERLLARATVGPVYVTETFYRTITSI